MYIIFLYLLILFALAFLNRRKAHLEEYYYLAGREVSCLHLTFSLLATILGASSTIGLVGLAYKVGLPASFWLISGSFGLLLLSLLYKKYRCPEKVFTLPEFLEMIYGHNVKKIISIIIFISWLGVISAQILAMEKIFSLFFSGVSSNYILLFSAFILVFYTAIGGQRTVISTDFIQFILLFLGIISLSFVLVFKTGFNFSSLNSELFRFPINNYFKFKEIFYFLVILGSVYLIGPDIHSRLFCTDNIKIRRRALGISAFLLIPLGILISLIGIISHCYFSEVMPDEILPLIIKEIFGFSFISYLFLLSLISALFSSADTCLLTSATIFIRDILNFKNKRGIFLAQVSIIVIGIVSYFVSIYFKRIISVLLLSYSVYTAGILSPFLLIPFKDKFKIKNQAVFLSIVTAGGLALIGNILSNTSLVIFSYIIGGTILFLFSIFK